MKHVHKEYSFPFVLEPTKLKRLLDTIHDRLAEHPGTVPLDRFEAFLKDNRREVVSALEEVVALDNSHKKRIERLIVTCTASTPGAETRPEHEVQVDFASPKTNEKGEASGTKIISISVRSDSAGWISSTLSEVEEQVERTRTESAPVLLPVLFVLALLVVLLIQLPPTPRWPDSAHMWLNDSDLVRVDSMLRRERVLSDESAREIATMQSHNLVNAVKPSPAVPSREVGILITLGVPAIVLLLCIVVLLGTYPGAVFLWGDEIDRNKRTLNRRKVVWGIFIAVTVVSITSRFLYEGLSKTLFHQP